MAHAQPVSALVVTLVADLAPAIYSINRLCPESLCFVLPESAKPLVESGVQPKLNQMPRRWDWVLLSDIDHFPSCHQTIARRLPGMLRNWGIEPGSELFEALQKKDLPALRSLAKGLDAKTREALLLLPKLYGGREVLEEAAKRLPRIPALTRALATLRALADACPIPASFDLAELRGYHYHSGVVFDAYCKGLARPVARGGRYDEVGKAFGRPRAATGFSIDLRALAGVASIKPWKVKRLPRT